MTADPTPEPVTVDPVLAERARAAYRARDILFGMDPAPSDVIIVADWLLTGEARLALEFDRALAENYHDVEESETDAWGRRPGPRPVTVSSPPDVDD